jgi:hypothetical protein
VRLEVLKAYLKFWVFTVLNWRYTDEVLIYFVATQRTFILEKLIDLDLWKLINVQDVGRLDICFQVSALTFCSVPWH